MADLTLELNIYSAKDLENVNLITKMDIYAMVWVNGDDSEKCRKEKTPVDRTGGYEPTWNHFVKFCINQKLACEGRLTLNVKLVCERMLGDKDLGEVQVPVLELLGSSSSPSFNGDSSGNGQRMMRFVTYQVRTPAGRGQGSLTFSYRFYTPLFKPDLSIGSSPVYPNPIETSSSFPSSTTYPPSPKTYPPSLTTYPPSSTTYPPSPTTYPPPSTTYPPPFESDLYPSLASIGYSPSSQPQGYSTPPSFQSQAYAAPPHPYPNHYDSPYSEQANAVYPPLSPSASNIYPSSSYTTSPSPHHLYPPPLGNSYHQTQPPQSIHGYVMSPPQHHHGYIYPPPPSSSYRYGCPRTQAPPKKNKVGHGMGAGLWGGALGGLIIGDMVIDSDF